MAPLLSLLGLCASAAAPVAGGTQLALYPPGVERLAGWFAGETWDLAEDEVGGPYECWDELGIRQFNLTIPVEDVRATLGDGYLDLRVTFGTVHGEDMVVYGLDEDYLDLCPEFDSELWYLTVTDAVFTTAVAPRVRDGALQVEVLGTPTVTGDLDMDIDWWPDDLVLAFYEETIFEELGAYAAELVPALAAEALGEQALAGTWDEYAFDAALTDADAAPEGLLLGADLAVTWLGEASCDPGPEQDAAGRQPELDLSDARGSTLAVGVTERQLNGLVRQLQADGFFCFDADRMDLVYEAVEELFDPSIGSLQASAVLAEAPVVTMDPGGAAALLQGITLEVVGDVDGERVSLLRAEADLQAVLELGVDPVLAALSLDLHALDLTLTALEAEHLLSDDADAEAHLAAFLEGWVAGWVEEQLQGVPLFAAQYSLYDTILRLDGVEWLAGGAVVRASLYDADDPAVDLTPPETEAWLAEALPAAHAARLGWRGEDDRAEALAFAWDLDGAGWSEWTAATEATAEGLVPGPHRLRVKARDGWLNEDPEPAVVDFDLPASGAVSDPGEGCGCAGRRGGHGWPAILGLVLAARLARGPRRDRAGTRPRSFSA